MPNKTLSKAQLYNQLLEQAGLMFWNMPQVNQELEGQNPMPAEAGMMRTDTMNPANPNVPDFNKGPQDWQTAFPPELTLRGTRGFVHQSASRMDGSEPHMSDYNTTGAHPRPLRLAERLLQKNEQSQENTRVN